MVENKKGMLDRLKAVWQAAFGQLSQDGIQVNRPSGSAAGKTVTASSAMEVAAFWAGVRLLSETVGTVPMSLLRSDAQGNWSPAKDHSLYTILHSSPSADFTAVEFWEGVTLGLCLAGNFYARKEMLGERLVALTPLRSDVMQVRRNRAGAREYVYSDPRERKIYQEREIFHVRGFGGSGDVGLSPVAFARQSLGAAIAADEFAGTMWKNGARPTGVFTIDQTLDENQRKQFQENIVAPYIGSQNAGGVMVLEAGVKFQPITMTLEDAQFLQTRGFNVEEVCRWLRIPPAMIGHTEKTNSLGTGLEQQLIAFLTFSLRPYFARIEQAIFRSLMTPVERLTLKAEFRAEGLLRTDSAARASFYTVMVQNGIMTRNEVRRLENLPPLPGGDELTVQSQNVPLGHNGGPPLDPGA